MRVAPPLEATPLLEGLSLLEHLLTPWSEHLLLSGHVAALAVEAGPPLGHEHLCCCRSKVRRRGTSEKETERDR